MACSISTGADARRPSIVLLTYRPIETLFCRPAFIEPLKISVCEMSHENELNIFSLNPPDSLAPPASMEDVSSTFVHFVIRPVCTTDGLLGDVSFILLRLSK